MTVATNTRSMRPAIEAKNIRDESLSSRIRILNKDILSATGKYDVVIANRLLHHINDTKQFWKLINSLSENILVIDDLKFNINE